MQMVADLDWGQKELKNCVLVCPQWAMANPLVRVACWDCRCVTQWLECCEHPSVHEAFIEVALYILSPVV